MPSTADKAKAYDKLIQETPSVDTSTSKAKAEFREGMKDEAEHSDDPKIKEKLVKDHMAKYKDSPVGYYEALEKLEDTLQGLKKTAAKSIATQQEHSEVTSYDSSKPEQAGTIAKDKAGVKVDKEPAKVIEKEEVKPLFPNQLPEGTFDVRDLAGTRFYTTGINKKACVMFAQEP